MCFSACLNPLTVCFHTKLIKDFLNGEHAVKDRAGPDLRSFLQIVQKHTVYPATPALSWKKRKI